MGETLGVGGSRAPDVGGRGEALGHSWLGVVDGMLVANDRRNRRYEFPLDGSGRAPHSHRVTFSGSKPPQRHYLDGRGQAVVVLSDGSCWDVNEGREVAEAVGLVFDGVPDVPPLRDVVALLSGRYVVPWRNAGTQRSRHRG